MNFRGMSTLALSASLLFGCQGPAINGSNASQYVQQFTSGTAELGRDNPFALPTAAEKVEFKRLWQAGDWPGLAKAVLQNGYEMDLNWFYLGEAAKGLGLAEPARIYYNKSIDDSNYGYYRSCIKLGGCMGFSLPGDATSAVAQVGEAPRVAQASGVPAYFSDPYVQTIMPDAVIISADAKFNDIGLRNLPAILGRCETEAKRRQGNIQECWALDMHAWMINLAMANVTHQPGIPGLGTDESKRRWHVYAAALGVPSGKYQMVEDGSFQRVSALAMNKH